MEHDKDEIKYWQWAVLVGIVVGLIYGAIITLLILNLIYGQ